MGAVARKKEGHQSMPGRSRRPRQKGLSGQHDLAASEHSAMAGMVSVRSGRPRHAHSQAIGVSGMVYRILEPSANGNGGGPTAKP